VSKPSHQIRDDEIYARRMRGETLDKLAEEFGLSKDRISQITRQVSRSLPERDRAELLVLSIEWLEDLREKVIDLYSKGPAPVFVGKDGDRATFEDGSPVFDYSLQKAMIAEAHRLNQTFAKRLGLDAPTQSEVNASVQYEIVGVDPEELK
jgi:hypothetical protein